VKSHHNSGKPRTNGKRRRYSEHVKQRHISPIGKTKLVLYAAKEGWFSTGGYRVKLIEGKGGPLNPVLNNPLYCG